MTHQTHQTHQTQQARHHQVHPQGPYSPNAIPPRTSSSGILNGLKLRSSVLRPLSEIDWMSQSKKSKHSHHSSLPATTTAPFLRNAYSQDMDAIARQPPTAYPTTSATTSSPPPPPAPEQHNGIGSELIYGNGSRWTNEKERILMGPYEYLYGHPGKDIRSQSIAAFNKWLRVPPARLEVITRVVGMLHTASLLYVSCPSFWIPPGSGVTQADTSLTPPVWTTSKIPLSYVVASLLLIAFSALHKPSIPPIMYTSRLSRSWLS